MSFTINRNINFKTIKKNINISNTININSLKESLGSTASSDFLSINILSINNIQINASASELNYLQVTPGIAQALKGLVVDSSRNINNINTINCNSIRINGDLITSNDDLNGGSSDDLNNPYLTNLVPGIAQANKALVLNELKNIKNINNLTTNELILENTNINLYNYDKIFINDVSNYINTHRTIQNRYLNTNSLGSSSSFNSTMSNYSTLNDVAWSPDLELFVVVASGTQSWNNTNSKINISKNGTDWISLSHINQGTDVSTVIWSNISKLFLALYGGSLMGSNNGSSWFNISTPGTYSYIYEVNNYIVLLGGTNKMVISQDGYNWKFVNLVNENTLDNIIWVSSLNMYILFSGSGTSNSKIYISNDCINWVDIQITYYTNTGQGFYTSAFSEELSIIVAGGTGNVFYSSNGINWTICPQCDGGFPTFNTIIWNSELQSFIGMASGSNFLYMSYNGINWTRYNSFSNGGYKKCAWSEKLGMLLFLTNGSISNLYTNTKNKNLSTSLIKIDTNNNYTGINKINPQSALEINSENGLCLKLNQINRTYYDSSNSYSTTFDVLENGQFNINAYRLLNVEQRGIKINTNFSTYGLKLNNILLRPTITEYNYLKNNILGTGSINKILCLDSNRNISNINNINCNSLVINNNLINSETFNSNEYLQNNILGQANASKALIVNINKNITNLNLLQSNDLSFSSYNKLLTSNINKTVNIDKLQKNTIDKNSFLTLNNTNKWGAKSNTFYTSNTYQQIYWCNELNIFLAVGSIIATSSDGINWTSQLLPINSFYCESVVWSSKLSLLVAVSSSTNNYNIMTSIDGINWTLRFNPFSDMGLKKVIWINELEIFLAIGYNGSIVRGLVSSDGENWNRSNLSNSNAWNSVVWVNHLNLIMAVGNTNSSIAISSNGINWTYITPPTSNITGYSSLVYSKELGMLIATTGWNTYYSFDGTNWYYNSNNEYSQYMVWISQLNVFMSVHTQYITYSYDGINWFRLVSFSGSFINNGYVSIGWSPYLNMFVLGATYGTYRLVYSDSLSLLHTKSNMYSHKSHLYLNKINGNLGLGTLNPNYQLELSTDNAKKPSTNTWTIVSDQRLKDNIENANLDSCYNIIKNLNLKKYKWKNGIFSDKQIKDKTKLGWIANDVEIHFPKAIITKNIYNIEDCKTLNIDQLVATIYGCTQKIINNYENLDFNVDDLQNKLDNIQNFINNL
jgi:hypothetical protein